MVVIFLTLPIHDIDDNDQNYDNGNDDNDDGDDDNDDGDDDNDDDERQVFPSHIKLIIDAFNLLCKTLLPLAAM